MSPFGAGETLIDLYARARAFGPAPMTMVEDQVYGFDLMLDRASALAGNLCGRFGVGRGTPVAIVMTNSAEWMIAYMAATMAGGIAVMVNSRGAPEELWGAVARTGCKIALAQPALAAALRQGGAPGGLPVIQTGGGPGSFEALSELGRAPDPPPVEITPADGAAVLFTSGTTGHPKGALHSHGSLMQAIRMAAAAGEAADRCWEREMGGLIEPHRGSNRSPTIIAGPLFHLGGMVPFLRCLHFGVKTILLGKWRPERLLDIIAREGVTRLGLVPTMLWDLLRHPDAGPDNIGRILFISSGAAAISPALTAEIARRMPGCMLGNTYGSTETAGWVATLWGREFLANPTACGRPFPGVEIRLIDEAGRDAPEGEPGELAVKSPCAMVGYLGDEAATAECFVDGWLRTGDIARRDTGGLLHIVDRKKNMVISGGENIYCAEVERVLSEHPDVLEVLAFGLPDARLGERLAVLIVPKAGAALTAQAVKAYAASRLAIYKAPREVVFRKQPFDRIASGKIDRLGHVGAARAAAAG